MLKKLFFLFSLSLGINALHAQKDSASINANPDAYINYDELFAELDNFLDSLLAPRDFTLINVSGSNRSFTYNKGNKIERVSHVHLTPSLGFYSKTGLGINGTASMVREEKRLQAYQYSLTGSYDYLKSFDFAMGFAATHFFTNKEVKFYTSPLQNEMYSYFTYRKWWVKPTISAKYGWGSRADYQQRESIISTMLPLPQNGGSMNSATRKYIRFYQQYFC